MPGITVEEARHIVGKSYPEELTSVHDFYIGYLKKYFEEEGGGEFAVMASMNALFIAGRTLGIRQERARRRGKGCSYTGPTGLFEKAGRKEAASSR